MMPNTKQLRFYTDAEIAEMTAAEREALLIEWILQLDDVNSQAMFILLDAVDSGESWRTATEKAVEYLKTHPGYENSARSLVEGLERMEAKHGK